jgi:dihydroorotate dehydrogenase electron transfer subunit
MSVASVSGQANEIEIILKVLGRGTKMMSGLKKGDPVNILGPLGVPFKFPRRNQTVIMVAGGVGFPPLLYLATEMIARGHDPALIEFFYGGRSAGDIVEKTRIRKLGVKLRPVTEDGSLGSRGLVTQAVKEFITSRKETAKPVMYGCGPEGMLKATDDLGRKYGVGGQLSLEAPMPCGIGICLGCVVNLREGGHARVCCDGPVFDIGEVIL